MKYQDMKSLMTYKDKLLTFFSRFKIDTIWVSYSELKNPFLILFFIKFVNVNSCRISSDYYIDFPDSAKWGRLQNLTEDNSGEGLQCAFDDLFNNNKAKPEIEKLIRILGRHNVSNELYPYLIQQISEYSFDQESIDFSECLDFVLELFLEYEDKNDVECPYPKEIIELLMSFLPEKENVAVYNPFAGYASVALNIPQGASYYGEELMAETWAIGYLRLLANRLTSKNIKFYHERSSSEWNKDRLIVFPDIVKESKRVYQYDYITGILPFRVKEGRIIGERPKYDFTDSIILDQAASNPNPHTKCAFVVSSSILYSGGQEKKLREDLVERDVIEMIITLPSNLFHHTGISTSIIIINPKKDSKGKIRFIDASKLVIEDPRRRRKLNLKEIHNEVSEPGKISRIVGNSTIKNQDYILDCKRYFLASKENTTDSKPLSRVLEKVCGNKYNLPSQGKVLKISDLSKDRFNYRLNLEQIKDGEIKDGFYVISESCLIISPSTSNLRPTYFEYVDEPIYVSGRIDAFKVLSNAIEIDYLVNQLYSNEVLEQINAYRLGESIKSLSVRDFLKIRIHAPSIQVQKSLGKGLQMLTDQILQLEKERNAAAHGLKRGQFNETASLKHSIGAPRQNILSNAKSLIRFFERQESNKVDDIKKLYRSEYNIDLIDVLSQIRDDINHISVILEKGENGLTLEDYPVVVLPLKEIEEYFTSLKKNGYNFEFKKEFVLEYNEEEDGIECNMVLLKILMTNILENASKHGFQAENVSNRVIIELKIIDSNLELTIKNNGAPFPKNYTKEKFITKFNSTTDTGTGMGGYDINRIANYLGDENWSLDLGSTLYPVIYKFHFEIKPLK